MPDIRTLQALLTEAASAHLPDVRGVAELVLKSKSDGSLVTDIDAALQQNIESALAANWPDIPMLGEEMTHKRQAQLLAHAGKALWVLDPLDGTTNFTTGFPMYGISLALVQDGQTRMAIIYDPNRKECFSAELGQGAYLNGEPMGAGRLDDLSSCVANIDYKRLTSALAGQLVACPPYRSQRNIGSCVLEWCWLAADRIQLYLHGGQHLWDHAAGRLILSEAGGVASRLDGGTMDSNTLIKQSAIAASNPQLYRRWFDWIKLQGG